MSDLAEAGSVFLADCPARLAVELIGNKWSLVTSNRRGEDCIAPPLPGVETTSWIFNSAATVSRCRDVKSDPWSV